MSGKRKIPWIVRAERTCFQCRQTYPPRTDSQKFCSTECYQVFHDKWAQFSRARGWASLEMRGMRRVCMRCLAVFKPKRQKQKVCGKKCSTAICKELWRARNSNAN